MAADVPALVTTCTSTVPAVCEGAMALIELAEFTIYEVAAVPPNVTLVTPLKLVPLMVTLVPPDPVPEPGETPLTVGPVDVYVN